MSTPSPPSDALTGHGAGSIHRVATTQKQKPLDIHTSFIMRSPVPLAEALGHRADRDVDTGTTGVRKLKGGAGDEGQTMVSDRGVRPSDESSAVVPIWAGRYDAEVWHFWRFPRKVREMFTDHSDETVLPRAASLGRRC